jgi:hypothetical protein
MGTLTVTKAGWTVSIDVPSDGQVMDNLRADTMSQIVTAAFQIIAADADLSTDERVNKLDAVGDLLLAIQDARAGFLPALQISPEA